MDKANPDIASDVTIPSENPSYIHGKNGEPSRYEVPNESGYFPAGSDDIGAVATLENVTIYNIDPDQYCKGELEKGEKALARGKLTWRDPDGGTADDVALVGECTVSENPDRRQPGVQEVIVFYLMTDDATIKISDKEFVLLLPKECILLDLTECTDDSMVLQMEGLLAARTKFHDQTSEVVTVEGVSEEGEGEEAKQSIKYPEELPDDAVSRALFRTSLQISRLIVSASKVGAEKIDSYGEKKRESVTKTKEVKVAKSSIAAAKAARSASEFALSKAVKLSDKISDVVGGKVGRAAAIKDGDRHSKKKARNLLLASFLAYAEVGGGASEGYEIMVKSAQMQATSFVAKKYGVEAAELARHTAGATTNFGRTALTARRVVNVKKLAKSAGKQMVKEGIKTTVGVK